MKQLKIEIIVIKQINVQKGTRPISRLRFRVFEFMVWGSILLLAFKQRRLEKNGALNE
jgi:hypothetical protein